MIKFKNTLSSPVGFPIITSDYGQRILNGVSQFHDGIDIINAAQNVADRLNPHNTDVFSIAPGFVCSDYDKYDDRFRFDLQGHKPDSAGNMVIIDSEIEGVRYFIRYLHLIRNCVSQGQQVTRGQKIGDYADVGYSYGAHTHIDVYLHDWSKKIDPKSVFC